MAHVLEKFPLQREPFLDAFGLFVGLEHLKIDKVPVLVLAQEFLPQGVVVVRERDDIDLILDINNLLYIVYILVGVNILEPADNQDGKCLLQN